MSTKRWWMKIHKMSGEICAIFASKPTYLGMSYDVAEIVVKSEKIRQKHIEFVKNNPVSPKMQAALDKLKDPEEFRKHFKHVSEYSKE